MSEPTEPVRRIIDQLKLIGVRLSFPDLFEAKSVNKGEPRYGAVFLLNKSDDEGQIKAIRVVMWQLAKAQWGGKAKQMLEKGNVKICLHEGSEKEYDGYTDAIMFVSSTSKRRPSVVDRDRSPLTKDDNRPYAGCYVNAVVRFWVQDNQWGKRINCELQGVQFASDGESFGAAPFDPSEHFEELEKPRNGGGDASAAERADAEAHGEPDDDEIPF